MNKKQAFTLVELLVVIAIISVLAALLLPALQKAVAEARKAVCVSNHKQQGIAAAMYCDDYNGWFIGLTFTRNEAMRGAKVAFGGHRIAHLEHYPYLESTSVFYCPDWTPGYNAASNYYEDPASLARELVTHYETPVIGTNIRTTTMTPWVYYEPLNPVYLYVHKTLAVTPGGAYISGKLEDNMRSTSGKVVPIMFDAQYWPVGGSVASVHGGGHNGDFTPLLRPDMAVIGMNYPFRERNGSGYRYPGDGTGMLAIWNAMIDACNE